MNPSPTPSPTNEPGPATEANVQALIAKAYVPVVPDAHFPGQAARAMLARPRSGLSPRRRFLAWAAIAAAIAVVALGPRTSDPVGPQLRRDGDVVWVDGVAYRRAGGSVGNWERLGPDPSALDGVGGGLVARPRGVPAQIEALPVGAECATGPGARKLVVLSDGTRVALDHTTRIAVRADRRLEVLAGRVFVEVAPRDAADAGARFVVATPDREVVALGTKFAVALEGTSSAVHVTQGAVEVRARATDAAAVRVAAGQQLLSSAERGGSTVVAAPRATHALDWTYELVQASESPCVPRSAHAGGALICVDPWGNSAKLALRRYHVDVHIEDGFARTTIDQTYFNHDNRRLEGTFYFPLPADASLSRLAMYVDGKLMEGGMAERERAREVFEQIISAQRDPALLEWVDGSTFKMRVFPLEPREEKRILISYAQKLDSSYGRARYRFPAGHDLGLVRSWSCALRLVGGADGATWRSPSHSLAATRDGADLVLAAQAEHATFDKDLVVEVDPVAPVASGARLAEYVHEGARYLALRWRPELAAAAGPRPRRDWVFLVETSGQRDPVLARAQVEVVRAMLEHGEHADTFNVLVAGTRVRRLSDAPVAADAAGVARAVAFLDGAHLVGALDLGQAFAEARALTDPAGKPAGWNPVLVHIGSGVATLGERRIDELAKATGEAPYVGLGIGKRWSRQLMKSAAARTGGLFAQINPDEVVAWRARQALAALDAPRLLDVRAIDASEQVQFLAAEDALAQGEELFAVARIEAGKPLPKRIVVSGRLGGVTQSFPIDVARPAVGGSYLPRSWARLEIERLLAADATANKDAVVELSKRMYVMSPFTSLLVLESEKMYEEFKIDRGRKDHWAMYPAPAQVPVVFEPDPRYPISQFSRGRDLPVAPAAEAKPTAEQILDSIIVRMPPSLVYQHYRPYHGGSAYTAHQLMSGEVDGWERWGWWGRYYDPSGRRGMEQWAENVGLAAPSSGTKVAPATVTVSDRLERRLSSDAKRPMRMVERAQQQAQAMGKSIAMEGQRQSSPGFRQGAWGGRLNGASLRGEMKKSKELGLAKGERFAGRDELSAIGDADELIQRIWQGSHVRGYRLLHQPPQWNNDWRYYADLLHHAPALNTTGADVEATLELEAQVGPETEAGHVDPQARALIDAARAHGGRRATISLAGSATFELRYDGAGRFAYERTLPSGLVEQAHCDGTHLVHVYPELGLASRRRCSSAYRRELEEWLPMLVASADDLARGHDVRLAGDRVVALVPRGLAAREDGAIAPHAEVELVFDVSGRLAERRLIERPTGKDLGRECMDADGRVRRYDAAGKLTGDVSLATADGTLEAARLAPSLSDVVVLPMPFRSNQHAWTTRKLTNHEYATWSDDDTMAIVSSWITQNPGAIRNIFAQRCLPRGDRRLGWYVLMLASHQSWDPDQAIDGKDGPSMGPTVEQRATPLGRYVAGMLTISRHGTHHGLPAIEDPACPLLARQSRLYRGVAECQSGRGRQLPVAQRGALARELLAIARSAEDPELLIGLVTMLRDSLADTPQLALELRSGLDELALRPELTYLARYEAARLLQRAGQHAEARKAFEALYREAANDGALPRIDHDFVNALGGAEDGFATFVRGEADAMLDAGRLVRAIELAWQCQQLGQGPLLSGEILGRVLGHKLAFGNLEVAFAAIEMRCATGEHGRAEALVTGLLADPARVDRADLWRLGAMLAGQRGDAGRALVCRERAVALEMASLPEIVNLQAVRIELSGLLEQYRSFAGAVEAIGGSVPEGFVGRVVKIADLWRALDTDDTAACQAAAQILESLGAHALAWDYLTTPLADQPNEAAPWMALAAELSQQGQVELARRAYRSAAEIEPGNPNPRWMEAQLLLQSARLGEARAILETLAAREWPRPHTWIGQQAKRYLAGAGSR